MKPALFPKSLQYGGRAVLKCRARKVEISLLGDKRGRSSFNHISAPENCGRILAAGSMNRPKQSPRRPRPGRPAGFRHRSRGFRPELRTIAPSGAKVWKRGEAGSFFQKPPIRRSCSFEVPCSQG